MRSILVVVVVASIISLIVLGGGLLATQPRAPGDPFEETVTIPEGKDHRWDIETEGDAIYYSVEVVSGGNVDVIAAKFTYQDGEWGYFYLSGHRHFNVEKIDGTVKGLEDLNNFDLFVDNSNDMGIGSTGNVTVNVIIEHRASGSIWLVVVIAIIIFVSVIIGGLSRSGTVGENVEPPQQETESIYEPSPTSPRVMSADTYCPHCGAQQAYDEASGALYCPRCGSWG